jgi:hypothetical protein
MFDVIAPSSAFSVDASGRVAPWGHNVRNPSAAGGTTVALTTCVRLSRGGDPARTRTHRQSSEVMAADPAGFRVSITRQDVTPYSDKPPVSIGAK